MEINFKYITFQNILSFGALPTTIRFESGISLISGKNGEGKSSILDALSFCLYGQPYRKIKIKELQNRKNKTDLKVSCEFVVDGKDNILITRCMNPDKISIEKNGEDIDLLSSKKLNQDEIDKIIGINYQMFKQVISLAVNYNKPFLSQTLNEKREIVEQIFNIVIFGQMLKLLKKRNVDSKTKNEINNRSLVLVEQHIKSLRKRISELKDAHNNFQVNKDKDIENIDKKIKEYMSEKIEIDRNYQESMNNHKNEDNNNLLDNLNTYKNEKEIVIKNINENEYIIKSSEKMKTSIGEYDKCPVCNTKITEDHKKIEIERLTNEIDSKIKILEILKVERTYKEKEIEIIEKLIFDINDNNQKIKNLENALAKIEKEISHNEEHRNEVLERKLDIDVNSIENELELKKSEYKILWNDNKLLKQNLINNDIIQNILSENGIKAYFFKKLIPILNKKINEYIKIFELPIIIQFDEFMNETIYNMDNLRSNISYHAYSEGEKKRIDMSILLSFINITKTISNWNCNILMIDELLDSAIDENGLEKLVWSLKNLTYESKNLSIYIISHRIQQDYISQFKNCINVQKNSNGFSEVIFNKEI